MNGDDNDSQQPSENDGPTLTPEDLPAVQQHRLPPVRPIRNPPVIREQHLPEPESLQAQVLAMQGAIGTMFQRLDQQSKLLETQYQQSQAVTQEMLDTLRILQEAFGQVDALADKLARIAAALVKLYQLDQAERDQSIF